MATDPRQVLAAWGTGKIGLTLAPLWVLLAWLGILAWGWRRVPVSRRPYLAPLVAVLVLVSLEAASVPALVREPVEPGFQTDPVRIWRLAPWDRFYETNGQGFRNDRDIGPRTGPRVLCVGDSWVFGKAVRRDEAWPARLGRETGYEVVNAGVLGYGIYQAWLTLLDPGFSLEPDVVVLSNTRNQPQNAAFTVMGEDSAASWRRLLHRSHFYLWLRRSFHSWKLWQQARSGEGHLRVPGQDFDSRVMERMVRACRDRGIDVVLLLVEEFPGDLARMGHLEALAARWNLPVARVDMSDPRRRPPGDKVHPDAEGHRQIAAALAPVVRQAMEARLQGRGPSPVP